MRLLSGAFLSLLLLVQSVTAQQPAQVTATGPRVTAQAEVQKDTYFVFTVKYSTEAARAKAANMLRTDFKKETIHVLTESKEYMDVFLRQKDGGAAQRALRNPTNGWEWDDQISTIEQQPPPVPTPPLDKPGRATPEPIVSNGIEIRGKKRSGKGVILAVVDTGIDYTLEDFRDGNNSKLLYYWDTSARAASAGDDGCKTRLKATYPNGSPIGALYSRQALTEKIKNFSGAVNDDEDGHGTKCCAVAAGQGCAERKILPGVAPDVDLIAVRIAVGRALKNDYLFNAICEWLDQVAKDEGKPLVISCSWGKAFDGYDGSSGFERHINSRFPLDAKGRVLCFSAGNEGIGDYNTAVTLNADNSKQTIKWNAPTAGYILLYTDLEATKGKRTGVAFKGDQGKDATAHFGLHPPSGTYRTWFNVPAGAGEMTIELTGTDAVNVDAYIDSRVPHKQARTYLVNLGSFAGVKPVHGKRVGSPGTTPNAITVGSYDWNNSANGLDYFVHYGYKLEDGVAAPQYREMTIGELSAYSSPGPRRLADRDHPKPELAAPGQWYPVSNPRLFWKDDKNRVGLHNGTSAATPYTAGIIALMLECKPDMTLGEVRDELQKRVNKTGAPSKDPFRNPLDDPPNTHWGFGKLDIGAVKLILNDLTRE